VRIFASEIYQWGPGGQFIMHPAYGVGEQDVGELEVIGYDPATDQFRTYFFDHTGNVITETLTFPEMALGHGRQRTTAAKASSPTPAGP
jgi:hypothetical protein